MSDVAIQNYIGRDFSVAFVDDSKGVSIKNVILKTGLNIINGELWDKIKNHPTVKRLLDTEHNHYIARQKIIVGNDEDPRYQLIRDTFNKDGKTKKMLEVNDYRKLNKKNNGNS